jgi:HemY protein
MIQAQTQLLSHQNEQALATLTPLHAQHPQQAQATRLLIEAQRRLRDWQNLARLLPEARRRALLPENELDVLERDTHGALLNLPLPAGALPTLHQAWSAAPAVMRRHPDLVAVYARQLIRQGAPDEGADLLAATLEGEWDERLVLLYGEAQGAQPAVQLETAEEWHARHGESPALLLTLGRLARRNRQTARARDYLEKSIALDASAEAHAELALLFEETGDSAEALRHCRQALELCRDLHYPGKSGANRPGPGTSVASDYGY